jgi:hypothetical protein
VADPATTGLWGWLTEWVQQGGGLVVVPGGEGWAPKLTAYNDGDARKLMPGTFEKDEPNKVPREKQAIMWENDFRHPMLRLLRQWQSDDHLIFRLPGQEPSVIGYWSLKPDRDENVVLRYEDAAKTPAILERIVGQGKVIALTTAFDGRQEPTTERFWTNYNAVYFAPIFETLLLQYLAGESDDPNFNYQAGQTVPVGFPVGSPELNFTLVGPGLSNAEHAVSRGSVKQTTAEIDQAVSPGNYSLVEKDQQQRTHVFGAFSINADPNESKLSRVDAADIEKVLGPGSVVPVKYSDDLLQVLSEHWPEPVEWLPYVMILVLLALAGECLFSNLFYKRDDRVLADTPVPQLATSVQTAPAPEKAPV